MTESRVQFIRESVRDFLLKEGGLDELWRDIHAGGMVPGHEDLKICCWNYLKKAYIVGERIWPDDLPPANSPEAVALRAKTSKSLPFLDYAVNNVLQHAEAAEQSGVTQTDFLCYFDTYQWTYMYNLFEEYQVRRYAKRTRLTYMLADKNLSHLLKSTLEATPHNGIFNNCECRYCGSCQHPPRQTRGNRHRWASPFLAAVAERNEEVIRVLFTTRCTSYALQKEDLADLISRSSELKVPRKRTIFAHAMITGDLPLLRLVLSTGRVHWRTANVATKMSPKMPVMFAVKNRNYYLLKTVLDFGAVPDEWTINHHSYTNSPLGAAVELKQADMVRLLLERGADPNQYQPWYR